MDKKMKRQILFNPNVKVLVEKQPTVPKPTEKPKSDVIVAVQLNGGEKSKKLYKWLKTHPLINLNGLCKVVGMDRANFIKLATAEKEMKGEVLTKFIEELKKYGYAEI